MPPVAVTASTSSDGAPRAIHTATASSMPASTSRITFLANHRAALERAPAERGAHPASRSFYGVCRQFSSSPVGNDGFLLLFQPSSGSRLATCVILLVQKREAGAREVCAPIVRIRRVSSDHCGCAGLFGGVSFELAELVALLSAEASSWSSFLNPTFSRSS